jgi:Ca2+-binding EF-hand superfamily protein
LKVREAFHAYDYNGDGLIDAKEMAHIISRIGGATKLSKEEAVALVLEYDPEGRGFVRKADIWYDSFRIRLTFPSDAIAATLN